MSCDVTTKKINNIYELIILDICQITFFFKLSKNDTKVHQTHIKPTYCKNRLHFLY